MKRVKPTVTWTGDRTSKTAMQVQSDLPYYQRPVDPPRDVAEALVLGPGTMFVTKEPLYPQQGHQYPFAPVYPHYGPPEAAPIKKGQLVLYAGEVRCSEQRDGKIFQAVKHTFIMGGCRYILHDLTKVKPV
jgi:hypothetical protein